MAPVLVTFNDLEGHFPRSFPLCRPFQLQSVARDSPLVPTPGESRWVWIWDLAPSVTPWCVTSDASHGCRPLVSHFERGHQTLSLSAGHLLVTLSVDIRLRPRISPVVSNSWVQTPSSVAASWLVSSSVDIRHFPQSHPLVSYFECGHQLFWAYIRLCLNSHPLVSYFERGYQTTSPGAAPG